MGPIYKKKASTPTATSSHNHFRPGSARNMHIEYTENIEFEKQRKHRSVGDEYENVSNTQRLQIKTSSTSPAGKRSKYRPKKIKSENKLNKHRKLKKPRNKRPKLPSTEYYTGDHVMLSQNREGIILYIGEVDFAKGTFVGIELVNGAKGNHDGVYKGKRYFQTAPNQGIFIRESNILCKVLSTPNVSKRRYSMDMNDPNFVQQAKEKHLGHMHPLEPSKSYSNESDSLTPSNHSAQSQNHLTIQSNEREDSRPLSTKSLNGLSDSANYDILEFKEMVRAEIENEFQSKFDELKKMMLENKNEQKHHKHHHRKKKHKRKSKRRRNKSKRRKDKKSLNRLEKMEKRRRSRSKSRGQKLKSSEDDSKQLEHVKSVSLNIEINDFDPNEADVVIDSVSDEYRKNSDLNVNEEEYAFETDDDEHDEVADLDPIGLSLKSHGKNISLGVEDDTDGNEMKSPSNIMSDFDEKDIGYTNQLVQGSQNGQNNKYKGTGSGKFKFKW